MADFFRRRVNALDINVRVRREFKIQALIARHPSFEGLRKLGWRGSENSRWLRSGGFSDDLLMAFVGKTGYGKSSTVNVLVGAGVMYKSHVMACTRECQSVDYRLDDAGRYYLSLCDLPGLGESEYRNRKYLDLYANFLTKTHLSVYLLCADNRDFVVDKAAFARLYPDAASRKKVLIALNAADKVEPIQRGAPFSPTSGQLDTLRRKVSVVSRLFRIPASRVVPYSATEGWNMSALTSRMMKMLASAVRDAG